MKGKKNLVKVLQKRFYFIWMVTLQNFIYGLEGQDHLGRLQHSLSVGSQGVNIPWAGFKLELFSARKETAIRKYCPLETFLWLKGESSMQEYII